MRQTMRWTVSSLIFLSACGGIQFPDTDLCVVNAPGEKRKCYNLNRDYQSDGHLKPDAKPTYKVTKTVEDVNKNTCIDPDGLANLKAFIKDLRENYNCNKKQGTANDGSFNP